jgi:hypothetical protein
MTKQRLSPSYAKYKDTILAYRATHKDEYRAYMKEYMQKRREAGLDLVRYKQYGITKADYEALYATQKGLCKICKQKKAKYKLCVDHSHETKKVRGLLCRSCNLAIGHAKDNAQTLLSAAEYLSGKE